ncbi:glycosyltransferase family 4 protein [Marivirga arenosa]|uniref:Glycosyltransferase family 4 protein n=1 Tax=Marivirga arenosa TaxID=3059076 RepID=A0AA49J946_9BACT|nr:glycosyltransferase family 4 protein [Marivirga sp. BKB1-2]WKK79084.2 glycosyltransferase family 4 protein [Marivirga sp. BKB1-2]
MKVLHVSTEKVWRGGEQQIAYLIESLQQLGVENVLICNKNSKMHHYAKINKLNYRAVRIKNSIDLLAINSFVKIFKEVKADIVHLHNSKAHTLSLLANLFVPKQKFVLHRRVSFPISAGFINKIKYNANSLKRIICISKEIQTRVQNITDISKTEVIYSGINLDKFNNPIKEIDFRDRFQIDSEQIIIGGVGALSIEKDFNTFINTASIALKKVPNLSFLIVGDGPEKDKLKEIINQLGLNQKIILTGFLDNIPSLLSQLDIFMLCSQSEGLGTSFLDAFASKLPVVATRTGGVPEIVIHNKTGLITEPGNTELLAQFIIELAQNPEKRKKLGESAKKFVKDFSIEEMAKRHFNLYKKILNS